MVIRMVSLFLCCVLLTFTGNLWTSAAAKYMAQEDTGTFLGVVTDSDIDLNENTSNLKGFVVNEKLALEIGNAVIKSLQGEDSISNTEFIVYEIEGQNVIVVCRIPKNKQVLGGDINVAISKTNGQILKIWGGE